jgi:hypothetical protein
MSEHTPGPYTVKGPSKGRVDNGVRHAAGDYAIMDADDKIIGEAYNLVDYGKDGTRPAEANARLFASAPELLAACENMVRLAATGDDVEDFAVQMNMAMQQIRAAIAKAKGAVA